MEFMARCFPVWVDYEGFGKTTQQNNGNNTGADLFGNRVFSRIALYCTAVAMTVIAQSALAFTITRT
jgi:hypothetical protein